MWTKAMLPRPDESWEQFSKRTPATTPVPFALFSELFTVMREKINELSTSNKALMARVTGLEAAKSKSADDVGPRDCGVWDAGTTYRKHDGVTVDGHYWIAQRETRSTPTENSGDWRLAVRRGKPGRDGKPADTAAIDQRLQHFGLIP
jgi:hypothetical protein